MPRMGGASEASLGGTKPLGWVPAMKRVAIFLTMALLATAGAASWHWRLELADWWQGTAEPLLVIGRRSAPQPDVERYEVLREEAQRWRQEFDRAYRAAETDAQREAVLDDARAFLELILPDLMRCWLGTPWDFQGTAEGPGQGKVACGYFVATVLRDAGFKLNRYELAKRPSESILRAFLPREALTRRVGVPYDAYASELRGLEPGVRIVGLDTHVGFLVNDGRTFRFIHSSGSSPWCVVDEPEEEARVLRRSNYRVRGPITGNREVMRKWVCGERFE